MPLTPLSNPYIGPRSFQTGEAIYGRNREVRELLGLLIAERIVLLHSPSGAGKTSLVQAALIPRLQEQDFAVLPVMRVSLDSSLATADGRPQTTDHGPPTTDNTSANASSVVGRRSSVVNRYILSLLLSLEEDLPPEQQTPLDQLAHMSLAGYLDQRPKANESDGEVLIFDQFEEILTIEPTDLAAKTAFFAQVGAALRDRRRWALFSMREDYVAALAPYLRALPTRLGCTYRLDLLGAATAHAAIQEPARQRGVDFEDAAAARLIDDLRQVQVQRSDGSTEEQLGPTVEPVQLQVVCYRLWERRFGPTTIDNGPPTTDHRQETRDQRSETSDERPEALDGEPSVAAHLPTTDDGQDASVLGHTSVDENATISDLQSPISNLDPAEPLYGGPSVAADERPNALYGDPSVAALRITNADVEAVGDVNRALADYYTERVAAVADSTGVSERSIREWFDRRLITPQGIRGQVLQAQGQSEGLDNRAIWPLIDAYLVRAEKRRGATWFELAHDRLIEPVRDDNAAWRVAHLSTLQRQADLWDSQGRPDGLLLRDAVLVEAEAWVAANSIGLTPIEQDFLERCRQVREIIQRARRNNRIVRVLAIVATVIGVIAIVAATIAFVARGQAEQARIDAEQARTDAEQARGQAEQARTQAEQARGQAEQARDEAIARQLAAQSYDASEQAPQRALLLGIEAISQKGSPHLSVAETALYTALATAGGRPLYGHTQIINALAFSSDGRLLASAGDDQTVLLWALDQPGAAPAPPQQLLGHTQRVTALRFSPDGRTLASASDDGSTRLWNVGQPTTAPVVLAHGTPVIALAFSPDGRTLASAGADGSVRLWSTAQPTAAPIELVSGAASTNVLIFSRDGRRLAGGGDDGILRLWNIAQPAAAPDERSGHEGPIRALAFSPDGRTLASASDDASAQLWDMQLPDSPSIVLEGHLEAVTVLAFSSDGRMLATGSRDKNVQLWNIKDILRTPNRDRVPRPLVLSGHNSEVTGLAFAPDGRTLISASLDGTKRLWDIDRPGVTLAVLRGHEGPITTMALGSDGHTLATGSDDRTVRLWNLGATSAIPELHDRESSIAALALSPDGQTLATGGTPEGLVQTWNRNDLGAGPTLLGTHDDRVNVIAFSPDGRTLATGSDDQTVRLWDIANPQAEPVELGDTTEGIAALLFGADGRTLLAASFDGAVLRWDLATRTSTTVLPADVVGGANIMAFSPDGRYLATDDASKLVLLWDLTTPGALPFGLRGHEQATVALAFSPDGHMLASGSNDRTVRLWNIEDRQAEGLVLRGHTAAVQTLAFSPDGRTLATGSADTTIRLWQIANPVEPIVLPGHTDPLTALVFSADGHTLVSSDVDRTIWLWPTQERELIARACTTASRNLSWDEWQDSLEDEPYRKTCPSLPISPSLIDAAASRVEVGDLEGALDLVEQVDKLGGTDEIPPPAWSRLCRTGSLAGYAADLGDVCNRAVAMAPDDGPAHDSRGLARALTNDLPGAVEDFELYVAWARQHGVDAEQIARRETWIAELKAGRNPFTQAVLEQLQIE